MRRIFIAVIALLIATGPAAAALTDSEIRQDLQSASRMTLIQMGGHEILPGELGDWRNSIDTVLFKLLRGTELYRGPIRIMVVNDQDPYARFFPDGTMTVSSTLLDNIDLKVFELAVNEPRRARDYAAERERLLAPYFAYCAARFALDADFTAFKRTAEQTGTSRAAGGLLAALESTREETARIDIMAQIIMNLAGYNSRWYTDEYLPDTGSSERREPLLRSADTVEKATSYYGDLLRTLRSQTAYQDALTALENLRGNRPSNFYLSRLEALVLHQFWLSTIPPEQRQLKTLFPVATIDNPLLEKFIRLAEKKDVMPVVQSAGDSTVYQNACAAYRTVLAIHPDSALSSVYARLLFQGGETEQALAEAETAARMESRSSSFTARANYASILFMSGKDTAKARKILSQLSEKHTAPAETDQPSAAASSVLLYEGFPSDSRDILVNNAILYRSSGNHNASDMILKGLYPLIKKQNGGTVSFRGISLGSASTRISERWGNPDRIVFNYYSEKWNYPKLSASLSFSPSQENRDPSLIRIEMNEGSPISPGADIRTGDTRESFESAFGKPVYQSGDREIYLANDMRLSVLYLFNRIRSITAGY